MQRDYFVKNIDDFLPKDKKIEMAQRVRDDLLAMKGITQVELDSVRPYEITLEFKSSVLRQYGITLQQVADAISKSSIDISGGSIKSSGGEILLTSKGQAYHGAAFSNIVILNKADQCIKNAKTMDQYKECEKVEQEERRKGMRNLQIEKKQMIIDNLNSKIKKTTDFRNCIQEATTNQEMKNCRPQRIKE